MKKMYSVFILFILLLFGLEILINSSDILKCVIFSIDIFKNNVFPSLFPFFVLSSLLIKFGFPEFMNGIFKKVMYFFFKTNGKCSFIFFMSILSGNPSCARLIRELYLDGSINKYEAIKTLCTCSFASPLFVLGTSSILLKNKTLPFLILFCHYFGNILVGILIRSYHPSKYDNKKISFFKAINDMHNKRISNKDSFGTIITNSLTDSINTLLSILGIITLCLVITTIIDNNLNLPSVSQSVLNGFIEMTQGLKYISLENISINLKSLLFVMIISFGGLSVHLQIMSILSDTDLRYFPFLISRVISCLISSFTLYIILTCSIIKYNIIFIWFC